MGSGSQKGSTPEAASCHQTSRLPFIGTPLPVLENTSTLSDRKSTRLNSSHANISYAVFCLKKKTPYLYFHFFPSHLPPFPWSLLFTILLSTFRFSSSSLPLTPSSSLPFCPAPIYFRFSPLS